MSCAVLRAGSIETAVVRRHPEQLPRESCIGGVSDQQDRQHEAERAMRSSSSRGTEGCAIRRPLEGDHSLYD